MKHQSPDMIWDTAQLYLDDQLSATERSEFETLMNENEEIRELVAYFRYLDEQEERLEQVPQESLSAQTEFHYPVAQQLHKMARNARHFSLQYYLGTFLQNTPTDKIPEFQLRELSIREIWKTAMQKKWQLFLKSLSGKIILSTLLLLLIAGGYQWVKVLVSGGAQFSAHQEALMEQFRDYAFLMGGGTGAPELEQSIVKDYNDQLYRRTQMKINRMLGMEENLDLRTQDVGYYGTMQLHQAICFIRMGKINQALDILIELNQIQAEIHTVEDQVIPFYLAFAYLMDGEEEEAKKLLLLTQFSTVNLQNQDPAETATTVGEVSRSLLKKLD